MLCDAHAGEAGDGVWPFDTVRVFDIRHQCLDCAEQMNPYLPVPPVFSIQTHPDLTAAQARRLRAVSTAATASADVLAGGTFDYCDIDPPADAGCIWGSRHKAGDKYIATLWVGGIAALRWLDEAGLATWDHRIGTAAGSLLDQVIMRRDAAAHGLTVGTGRAMAGVFIDQQWEFINEVANFLVAEGVATGAQIAAMCEGRQWPPSAED